MTLADAIEHAHHADRKWNNAMREANTCRWHQASRGTEGSLLRRLYEAKVAADRAMGEAFQASRNKAR